MKVNKDRGETGNYGRETSKFMLSMEDEMSLLKRGQATDESRFFFFYSTTKTETGGTR